jgi:hypothetical protein
MFCKIIHELHVLVDWLLPKLEQYHSRILSSEGPYLYCEWVLFRAHNNIHKLRQFGLYSFVQRISRLWKFQIPLLSHRLFGHTRLGSDGVLNYPITFMAMFVRLCINRFFLKNIYNTTTFTKRWLESLCHPPLSTVLILIDIFPFSMCQIRITDVTNAKWGRSRASSKSVMGTEYCQKKQKRPGSSHKGSFCKECNKH